MKKRIIGFITAAMCMSVLVISGTPVVAVAATESSSGKEVSVTNTHELVIPKEELINQQIIPGGIVKQIFSVHNNASQTVTVYMSSNMKVTDEAGKPIQTEAGKEFDTDLISKLKLQITDSNGTVLYVGPCTGNEADATGEFKTVYQTASITTGFFQTDTNKKGICLGAIPAGSSITLSAVVTMDGASFGNEYQNKYGLFNWNFYCEGDDPIIIPPSPTPGSDDPVTPTDPTNPTDPTDPEDPEDPGDGTDIEDPDVPGDGGDTDDGGSDDGDTNIDDEDTPTTDVTITDDDVPEADTLAHTGFKVVYLKEAGIILAVLVVALVAVSKAEKRKKMKKN